MRAALVLTLMIALASPAAAQDAAQLRRGQALLQRNCSACHAVGATGDSPNPAAPRFRELHRRYAIDNLAEALAEGMLTGHPAMPEFDFPPNDVRAIIAYLKSIQTGQQASLRRPFLPHLN
jgi:mono/diheme cytochrome c family protein